MKNIVHFFKRKIHLLRYQPDYKLNISSAIIHINHSRAKLASILLMILALVLLSMDIFYPALWDLQHLRLFLILDISLTALAFLALLFYWLPGRRSDRLQKIVLHIFSLLLLCWSAFISGIEYSYFHGFLTLFLVAFFISFFFYLDLPACLLFYLGILASLFLALFLFNNLNLSMLRKLYPLLPVLLLSFFTSRIVYHQKKRELLDRKKIMEMNQQLLNSKLTLDREVKFHTGELRKTNELLQLAKEKAEESNRLKTAFIHNISHEIRTPMNGILGFGSLICREGISPEKRKSYYSLLEKSCARLNDIITDMIEVARIQSKNNQLNKSKINLKQLFQEIDAMIRPLAEEKGLEFRTQIECCEKERFIETDEHKLFRSCQHLLHNAIKFTHTGFIELKCWRSKNNEITFSIKDSGIGIPPQKQQVIFEAFQQADNSLTRQYSGSGIGLYLVKAYLDMLGGTIRIDSEEGKGTEVILRIPFYPLENKKQPQHQQSLTPDWSTKTVLIVEDELINYLYLKEILEELGIQILHAKNGLEAVDYFKTEQAIDFVLMDLKMPIMDGYSATKQIKEKQPHLPVIAQTAYAQQEDITRLQEGEFDDYLTKPVEKEKLQKLLEKYLP